MQASVAKKSSLQIWWLAIRPRTLPAAAAPVIVGTALAFHANAFQFFPALAALLAALANRREFGERCF
jgi:1,4-dihydroxy-2-naphthoate octaprenyltransferase